MHITYKSILLTKNYKKLNVRDQGGLATAFDLAAFRLSMIAPVKKSVNHSTTVASMRETGWEKQQLIFPAIRPCEVNSLL